MNSSFFCPYMTDRRFSYPLRSSEWIEKLIYWADANFKYFSYLNGKNYGYPEHSFPHRLLAGNKSLTESEIWSENQQLPRVGIISYDFKNRIEQLSSSNPALIDLPELSFFVAEFDLIIENDRLFSSVELNLEFWKAVEQMVIPREKLSDLKLKSHSSQEQYFQAFEEIQNQIRAGNTYELNYCQAFSAQFDHWNPIQDYFRLQEISHMPFSALFKFGDQWLVSASPERYIKKVGRRLITQPIKGTISRGHNQEQDLKNHKTLASSEKEQAENLMITDLMRNDLAKISEVGTVTVDELFGIYALPKVFQMISTVSSTIKEGMTFRDIIFSTFPMGSMTGAPKISTMQWIDRLENFKRNWFSGAFGILESNGDFDFSVIIRSVIGDLESKKLYFAVGSAVTIDAIAAQEYEECQLKAAALFEVLRGK